MSDANRRPAMLLRDHFRDDEFPPWPSVLLVWMAAIATRLNKTLPKQEHRASLNLHLGLRVEQYVRPNTEIPDDAPPPISRLGTAFVPEAEIHVSDCYHTVRPAAVVLFVCPENKADTARCQAFASKCETYLRQGVGMVVVDVVPAPAVNLHNLLMRRLGGEESSRLPADVTTSAVGYRPVSRTHGGEIDIWTRPLATGAPLPTVPLCLRKGPVVALDLAETYAQALADSGIR